ncbi:MAG: M23 family metallopeptidase [Bacteroidota bacterium]|nr:M23 family metallopeptidase [Bacteroidota bacterium]
MSYKVTFLIFALSLCFSKTPLFAQQKNDTIPANEVVDGDINDDNSTDTVVSRILPVNLNEVPCAELYNNWNNFVVNPYGISLLRKPDTTLINLSSYASPLTHFRYVSSEFGFRRYRWHYGIDLKLDVGDTVMSAFDGMIRIAKKGSGYGNYIVIRHYNGLETVYGHLSKILVNVNQVVKAGEIIALGGNTGHSTGPHLHFEVSYLGNRINPRDVIDFQESKVKTEEVALTSDNFKYESEAHKKRAIKGKKGRRHGKASIKRTKTIRGKALAKTVKGKTTKAKSTKSKAKPKAKKKTKR